MQGKRQRFDTPKTVDEAAEILIDDIPIGQRTVLVNMEEEEFMQFYSTVAEYIIEDFKIWNGNNALLNSCINWGDWNENQNDPAMIILKRVRAKLQDTDGIIIIT